MTTDSAPDGLTDFEPHRSRLFGLAYRMLGSAADADDVLQDAWLRWSRTDTDAIRSPAAWLTSTVTRLAIDRLRAAKARREEYVGPWLPEPLVTEDTDATMPAGLADDLSIALLLLLERLSPAERAVFILREAFDTPFDEIADIVGKTPDNCRQLLSRARQHVPDARRSQPVDPVVGQQVIERFLTAINAADYDGLTALLRDDVVMQSDGGGKAVAAKRPLHGVAEVANFLFGIARTAKGTPGVQPATINQRPGLLITLDGALAAVFVFDLDADGRIAAIHAMRNPDKLDRLRATIDGPEATP